MQILLKIEKDISTDELNVGQILEILAVNRSKDTPYLVVETNPQRWHYDTWCKNLEAHPIVSEPEV